MEQSNVPSERRRDPRWTFDQQPAMGDRVRERYWPGNLMALGIFVVVVSFWWVGMRTLITFMLLSKVFAVAAFVGNLLPYARSGARLGMERLEWFLFNLLAVGPLLLSSLLWTNYLVTGPERDYIALTHEGRIDVHRYWINHGELPEHALFAPTNMDAATLRYFMMRDDQPMFTLALGCFGFEVVQDRTRMEVLARAAH